MIKYLDESGLSLYDENIKKYIGDKIAELAGALTFKGLIDAGSEGTYNMNTHYPNPKVGDVCIVSSAGVVRYYDQDGQEFMNPEKEVGDTFICIETKPEGSSVTSYPRWAVLQTDWNAQAGSQNLAWNSAVTLATVGGVQIKAKMPAKPTASEIGAVATSNVASAMPTTSNELASSSSSATEITYTNSTSSPIKIIAGTWSLPKGGDDHSYFAIYDSNGDLVDGNAPQDDIPSNELFAIYYSLVGGLYGTKVYRLPAGGTAKAYSSGAGDIHIFKITYGDTGILTSRAVANYVDDQTETKVEQSTYEAGISTLQTAVNAKYTKPSTGIPKTDLESAVQTSLGKADTSVQKVTSTDNAVVRFNGTGGAVQNSGVTIDDSNNVTTAGNVQGKNFIVRGSNATNATRYISSDAANNMFVSIGGVIPFVATNTEVRRAGNASTINLGSSTYPWNNVYGKKFITTGGTSSQFVMGDGSLVNKIDTSLLREPDFTQSGYTTKTMWPLVNTMAGNTLVLLKANQIIIEQTIDGGETWTSGGYTDAQKQNLFLGTDTLASIAIPKIDGVRNKLCGIRITITGMNYNVPANTAETDKYQYWNSDYVASTDRYCSLDSVYLWVSGVNDYIRARVYCATGKNPNNWVDADRGTNAFLNGWSGGDVIALTGRNFGGGTTQTGNYWNYRFVFFTDGLNGGNLATTYTSSGQVIYRIQGFGQSHWTNGNKLMAINHLYTWDSSQNAIFPANISASGFIKSGGTSSQFLKADGSVDSTAYAPLASPTLTGTPNAPTATAGTNTTQIATTAFVQNALNSTKSYLTFEVVTAGTITIKASNANVAKTISYSTNNGSTWTSLTTSTTEKTLGGTLSAGTKVLVKGTNTAYATFDANDNYYNQFGGTAKVNISGNIMSLISGDDFTDSTVLSAYMTFYRLFYQYTNLLSAENLILPATTLAYNCYEGMFEGCTSLVTAPSTLPAMTLTDTCYGRMFCSCTSLVNAPKLPATSLASYCYSSMFEECTSLKTAPKLPAAALADNCYNSMFYGCTSLAAAPELPATVAVEKCYTYMFHGCSSLVEAPELPATTVADRCYRYMFANCTNLLKAPSILPATTLAIYCYQCMFQGCTSLKSAPELPATTLVNYCYSQMFDGCSALSYIKATFTTTPHYAYTDKWVRNVASSGQFVKHEGATWSVTGVDGIPNGWSVYRESEWELVHKGALDSSVASLQTAIGSKVEQSTYEAGVSDAVARIPFGEVDATSTSTVFTATVPNITELKDGVCCYLMNGVVTSASNWTLNINGLGAKPVYQTMAAGTRVTTGFNINYTILFVYNSKRIDGGCWDYFYGCDTNTNIIGYQLRTNSYTLPAADKTYRYRLLFTSADGSKFVPANTSTSTNATSARTPNTRAINPFGQIVYYSYNETIDAGANFRAAYLWTQNTLTLGYSFNNDGAALTLTYPAPVYIKCTPNADGSATINATEPYVQALPTTDDGFIYIHLGFAYSATAIELIPEHKVYYYKNGAIRLWTNRKENTHVYTIYQSSIDSMIRQYTAIGTTIPVSYDDIAADLSNGIIPIILNDVNEYHGWYEQWTVSAVKTASMGTIEIKLTHIAGAAVYTLTCGWTQGGLIINNATCYDLSSLSA